MKYLNISIILFTVVFIMSGCGSKADSSNIANRAGARIKSGETRVYKNTEPYKNDDAHDYDVEDFEYNSDQTMKRAEKIAKAVTALDNIEKASVVITGNSAVVGIEVVGELTDENLKQYKNEVETEVRKVESSIDHVAVTAGPEMVSKIKSLADYISGGDKKDMPESEEKENAINSLTPSM